jgi:hypothetical protein
MPLLINFPTNLLTTYPHLQILAHHLSERFSKKQVTDEDLKTIGLALWQVLDIDATLSSKTLIIKYHGHVVDNLPWECLYHPKLGFLGKCLDYTLSRYVENFQNPNPKFISEKWSPKFILEKEHPKYILDSWPKGPLKILLFTAQPEKMAPNLEPLAIEIEQYNIYQSLIPFIQAGKVHFYAPNDGRFTTFVKLLQTQTWHLVILSGHGFLKKIKIPPNPKKISLEKSNISTFFIFESETGESELVAAETLAHVFKDTNIQCAVVAACQSAQLLNESSLVMPIVQAGVPHVVGMREVLLDRAGTVFLQTLCVALAQQMRIDVAIQQSRYAMTQLLANNETWNDAQGPNPSNDPSIGQWSLPILISQNPTQPIIDWDFKPHPRLLNPIGSQITLPQIFIGRRCELRILGDALCTGKISRLLIRGKGGLGKTALAGRLVETLVQEGYQVLRYQEGEERNFELMLWQELKLLVNEKIPPSPPLAKGGIWVWNEKIHFFSKEGILALEIWLEKLAQEHWILWLDGLEHLQNSRTHQLTDTILQAILEKLSAWQNDKLRILLTSRWKIPQTLDFYDYRISSPKLNDFARYLKQLGLDYADSEVLKIYHSLGGNFQGGQLLQNLPSSHETKHLNKKLAIVQRYLYAYLR